MSVNLTAAECQALANAVDAWDGHLEGDPLCDAVASIVAERLALMTREARFSREATDVAVAERNHWITQARRIAKQRDEFEAEAAKALTHAQEVEQRLAMVRGLLAAYGEAEGTPVDYEFLVSQISQVIRKMKPQPLGRRMERESFAVGQRVVEVDTYDTHCTGIVVRQRPGQVLIQWDGIDGPMARTWSPIEDVEAAQ